MFDFLTDLIKLEITCSQLDILEYNDADVIVVCLDNQLTPTNELSQLIFDMAGVDVHEELQLVMSENNYSIAYGQVYSTTSGNLSNFKHILFAILPHTASDENNFDELLTSCVFNCLAECEFRDNHANIAFSMLDSLQLNGYSENVANILVNTFLDYFSNRDQTSIESIHLVESAHLNVFIECLKEKSNMPYSPIRIGLNNIADSNTNININASTNKSMTNSKSLASHSQIQVLYGSICDEKIVADVLVNSTNTELDLTNGILSKTLLNLGGQVIQDDLKAKYPRGLANATSEIAISSAGNLKNKKFIFHTVLPGWSNNDSKKSVDRIKQIIKSLLDEADKQNAATICFPALGTGVLKYPVEFIPGLMFDAFNEYLNEKQASSIKNIFIVVYEKDAPVIKAFQEYLSRTNDSEMPDRLG